MWGSSGFSPLSLSHQKRSVISPTRTYIHSHTFSPVDTGMRMLLPCIRTLMVPMSSDVHLITCDSDTDSYLSELSLALQSCELVRSAVAYDSANPEFTSECL
jgi:hypothetical protein